jgi:hypothetical protein
VMHWARLSYPPTDSWPKAPCKPLKLALAIKGSS